MYLYSRYIRLHMHKWLSIPRNPQPRWRFLPPSMDSPSPSKCNARARRPVGMQGDVEVLLHWRWWHTKMDVLFKLVWMQVCLSFAVCVCVLQKKCCRQHMSLWNEFWSSSFRMVIPGLLWGAGLRDLCHGSPRVWLPEDLICCWIWEICSLTRCHWASFELCASIRTCCYKLLLLFDSSTCFFL